MKTLILVITLAIIADMVYIKSQAKGKRKEPRVVHIPVKQLGYGARKYHIIVHHK